MGLERRSLWKKSLYEDFFFSNVDNYFIYDNSESSS